jgi:Z1 domain
MTQPNTQNVVAITQRLLAEEPPASVSASLIEEKLALVLQLNPKWGAEINREAVVDELIRRFSLWIGQDSTLQSNEGHVPWLDPAKVKEWKYWQRYRQWLEGRMSLNAVDGLDRSTSTVLGLLEDPVRDGTWDRRGLVVGHVQSGKTGHYTGLICKSADAGYKIIIVLAGIHNNLRSQTQLRLDEGFLGYESQPAKDFILTPIGVGLIDSDPAIKPNYATNRSEKGDFNTAIAKHLGITPEQRPWLFVVKKNKTVLERLCSWVRNHVANVTDQSTGERRVAHLPLLLIDDEADHASVDTGEQVFDQNGQPDVEHEPTAINTNIRKLLHLFSRAAYVGYTATPFANIFIHDRSATREEGPDLFPSAFIHSLAANSSYVGPSSLFGTASINGRTLGLPLLRNIDDHANALGEGWMPPGHKNGYKPSHPSPEGMPASLVKAIHAFVISCTVRRLRGQQKEHCSMLIHVTRYNNVQDDVSEAVDRYVHHLRQRLGRRIDHEQLTAALERLWVTDFLPTTQAIRAQRPDFKLDGIPSEDPSWDAVLSAIPDTLEEIEVRTINGTAKDALDYAEERATGLKVIAIGGDKLARGLTLEGLSVSYFLRASKMYDTLMQMGRWFGYRQGYLDLTRLYTTSELVQWFEHIADAAEELRDEFDMMVASGSNPKQYGLKVQSHPVLLVTSRLKMRAAKSLYLSFSGQLVETTALFRDPAILESNLAAARRLLDGLKHSESPIVRPRGEGRQQKWSGYLWHDVPVARILSFFADYRTHPVAYKVNSSLIGEFIRLMNLSGELTLWTVVLVGGGEGKALPGFPGLDIEMLKRQNEAPQESKTYTIGRLLSTRDESIDLNEQEWGAALRLTIAAWNKDAARRRVTEPDEPNGPACRRIRGFGDEATTIPGHPQRGLLLLYPLDPERAGNLPAGTPPIMAFGASFPSSRNEQTKVEYKVNNVAWEQEYGPAE